MKVNVFQKLWKLFIESDNQSLLDDIEKLRIKLSNVECLNIKLNISLGNEQELVDELELEIKDLVKHKKTLLLSDVLKPKDIMYKWKPTKNTFLRHSLDSFSNDGEYQGKYLSFLIGKGLKEKYASEKELIIKTYLIARKYLQSDNDNYDTDQESFGTEEYWLTPQEAFSYYVNGDEGDCDDYSAFIYGCLVTSLLHFGYDTTNLFRADIKIIGSCGHAVIQWWNGEQFLHLESTFAPERAYKIISSERNIAKSVYTDVIHFFNEEQEYVLK